MKKTLAALLISVSLLSSGAFAFDKTFSFGIGFPHFVDIYYLMRAGNTLHLGYGAGGVYIPTQKQPCGADVMINGINAEAMLRKYMWGNFFAGGRVGFQMFTTHTVQEVNAPHYDSTIGLNGIYITPSIGYDFRFSGFSFIPEIGAQIPLAFYRYETLIGPGDLEPQVKQVVNDNINRMNTVNPFVVLNIGYEF